MSTMLQTEHLTFAYPAEEGESAPTAALEDVTLSVEKGSFVVVLGHNGSGKSTLAKQMNAVLLPCGGTVYVDGMDTKQEALLLEIRRRVDDALKTVGMYNYRTHAPHLLSGGQKQRVAIAGIIAMEPKCIVLDEPTAMLDPRGRREVMQTIGRLNREKGITVVLITHHMDEAAQCQRVVVLHKGKVAADGTPQEVFSQVELLHSIGLAAPETVELCWELNHQGFQLPLDRLEPEDCAQALLDALNEAEKKA